MAHVSQKPLKQHVRTRLSRQLVHTVTSLRSTASSAQFISELLTETEQIMLAKRLMMIFMLAEGVSQYRIRHLLQMSPSTVLKTARTIDRGGYWHIARFCRQKKRREILWHELESLVRLGMPSRGRNRWEWLNKLYKK